MKPKSNSPSFAETWRQAGTVLSKHENRLTLIEAILVTFVVAMLYGTLQSVTALIIAPFEGEETLSALILGLVVIGVYFLLILLVTLFLTLPLVFGILTMASRAARGEEITLSMLFSPFSAGRRYARALGFSWAFLWRLSLFSLVAALTWSISIAFLGKAIWVWLLCGLLTALETVLFFWLSARRFFALAALIEADVPLRRAKRMVRGLPNVRGQLIFLVRFVPWILLGLVTVGILLLWDTLPRMAVMYFCYATRINEMNMIRSEETINE